MEKTDTDQRCEQIDDARRDDYLRNPIVYEAYNYARRNGLSQEQSLETIARRRFKRLEAAQRTPMQWYNRNLKPVALSSAFWIFYAIGAIPAVYLSWSCNSNHGFNAPSKVLFGAFAALGSWNYLLAYLFYKSYTCDPRASLAYKKAKLEEVL